MTEYVSGALYLLLMSGCTAPVQGHRSAAAQANCPECRYRSRRSTYSPPPRTYVAPPPPRRFPSYASSSPGGGGRSTGGSGSSSRARRSSVSYSQREHQTLNPVREQVVKIAQTVDAGRDLFLCHAWDDRQGTALELNNLLTDLDVSVWFSEMDVPLGTSLIRKIDKGLASSRAGIVLVTPSLFKSLNNEGIAAQELSALLATDRVIPIVHDTTFDELRRVSPLLAARSGLDTASYSSLEEVAAMIADTVLID
ncbi:toll/interleukin-1 receptor domain-containing protein [Gordonia sp. SL306]|uniref:toll/interleukin-1 receptor domain-containing protein n=1 Tax=Gordonia sp. SL306 TaxID=2995145 RepID=UPI00227095DC|nr:toll/interleukin-1 receptor domain-containing protein [Gordonia sp. SL306]WAC55024.1 toll/interleukin-1 receptor domain-containing protein [Gordonia sp. SL306]